MYLQALGSSAVRVHSAGYSLTMRPLQDTPHAVHVQSECGARGFSAPGNHMPPSLGGATLQVHETTIAGRADRLCIWNCELPYIKMPWNDPALTTARPTSTGRCMLTPESFTAVSLSFVARYPANDSLRLDSQQLLLGIDQMAEDMTASLLPRFGKLSVLLSMRNSLVNPHEVHDITAWVRAFNTRNNFDLDTRENPDFGLQAAVPSRRRLLQQNNSTNEFVIDGVIVAGRSDVAACCLADAAVEAQQALEPSSYDFDLPVSFADKPQISAVVLVTRTEVRLVQEMAPPSSEERSFVSTGTFLVVVLTVIVLACICLAQKDGFYKTGTEDDEDKEPP